MKTNPIQPSPSRSKLTTDEALVLGAWDDLPEEWGLGYHGVIQHTQKTKADLKPIISSLKQKGYLEFWRGGIDEEGLACGSGWGITRLGQEAYSAHLQTKSSPSNNPTSKEAVENYAANVKATSNNLKEPEHIFKPMAGGTGAVCSCGKEFATTAEQQQHLYWHLNLAKTIQRNLILDTILASEEMQNELIDPDSADITQAKIWERNGLRSEIRARVRTMFEGLRNGS